MRILIVSAEVVPFSKSGGLGEVMGALPKALHRLGHDVRVFTPLHGIVDRKNYAMVPIGQPSKISAGGETFQVRFHVSILSEEVPIYFLESWELFGRRKKMYLGPNTGLRYLVFNLSVFQLLKALDWVPDVIHCQDWHAALIPNLIRKLPPKSPYRTIATTQTIHNPVFSGPVSPWKIPLKLQDSARGPVPQENLAKINYLNFLKRGVRYADIVTTVSEQHAKELLIPGQDHGLRSFLLPRRRTLFGIRNGVDYGVFNPRYDPYLPVNYDAGLLHRKYDNKRALQHRMNLPVDETIPLLGMNSRITEQKGFDLIFEIFDDLMSLGVQLVVVGAGEDPKYVHAFEKKMKRYPKQVAYRPYENGLGSLVYAGADIFLMPSRFEPSGLGQMVSLRYGTIPVVRKTGGLADTITDYNPRTQAGNGFEFDEFVSPALLECIKRTLVVFADKKRWWNLMHRGMQLSYSWEIPAKKYTRIYRAAVKEHHGKPWEIPKKW